VYIDDSAVVIGEVELGDDVSIWPCTVVRGDVAGISIGDGSNIQEGSVLHGTHKGEYTPCGFSVSVGRCVTVGHGATVHGCTIGDYSLIGVGAIVMDGVVIEERVMIGAGSLVPPGKILESGYLYVGSPVRKIRALKSGEMDFLVYSSQHYIRLKNNYIAAFTDRG